MNGTEWSLYIILRNFTISEAQVVQSRSLQQPTGKPRCSSQDSNSDMRGILKGGMVPFQKGGMALREKVPQTRLGNQFYEVWIFEPEV